MQDPDERSGAWATSVEPPRGGGPVEPPDMPEGQAAPSGNAHAVSEPVAATRNETRTAVPTFARRDPEARARRLARALVSDIVAYHSERVEQALEQGTLRSVFKEEILKSWDEYAAQVGEERALATPYFRDALNEILAGGRKVF